MNTRVTLFLCFVATSVAALATYAGCSSDSKTNTNTGCKSNDKCDPEGHPELIDFENPPVACGTSDNCAPTCTNTAPVSTCPTDNECMSPTKQSGDVVNLRMGRIRLFAPLSLVSLTRIAVDPFVNPKCFQNGGGSFNWLMQIDRKNNTIKTGGSRKSPDEKTFAFLDETVDASKLEGICPGFEGPKEPVKLAPVDGKVTFTGQTFTTDKIALINVPIFDTTAGSVPVILPLRDSYIKNATLSTDGTCIGKWDKNFFCDGDTLGWTTGGAIVGKITVEDADKVPVKNASCQSLCAILVNDSTKTVISDKSKKPVCKRNADGTYPEIGDSCAGGGTCKNAFRLSATFSAYGISIGATTPPPDAGTDTGSDAATDSGSDAGSDGG